MNPQYYLMLQKRSLATEQKKTNTTLDFSSLGQDFSSISSTSAKLNIETREQMAIRLSRYAKNWKFYNGEHWDNPYYDGEKKAVFNYCKTIVDKGVSWFLAKGWQVCAPEGNEAVSELCNLVWKSNKRMMTTLSLTQFGAVTGDSFLYVSVDVGTKEIPKPKKEWKIKLQSINPQYVFPVWSATDEGEMDAVIMRYPVTENGEIVTKTIYITPQYFQQWTNESFDGQWENMLKLIPMVHFKNFILASSSYGMSDIEDVIDLNDEYNQIANSIKRIIRYHAEPTTLIYGAKASNLEKGANKVWSGLPIDAKVENLLLESDLTATYLYLEKLEALIYKMGRTPKIAFDSDKLSISNTSGLAMQMMFQPLIEKTTDRRITYEQGFTKANEVILRISENILGIDIKGLADEKERAYETYVSFTSPLPKDEQAELDVALKKIDARIWSRAQAMREVSGVADVEKLTIEIAADSRESLARKYEETKALNLILPNFASVFLSSDCLYMDFEDLTPGVENTARSGSKEEEAEV